MCLFACCCVFSLTKEESFSLNWMNRMTWQEKGTDLYLLHRGVTFVSRSKSQRKQQNQSVDACGPTQYVDSKLDRPCSKASRPCPKSMSESGEVTTALCCVE